MRSGKSGVMALLLAVFAGASSARADDTFQQVSALVESGHLNMDVSLHAGGIALPSGRRLAAVGAPVLRLGIDAVEGRLTRLSGRSSGGSIVLESPGLIPNVAIDSLEVDATGTITSARFRGRSFFGKMLVPLFRGKALKAVRRIKFNTAILDLVQGRLVDAGPAAATPAVKTGEGQEPSAMDLVDEICLDDSLLKAFPGKKLSLGGNFQITTDEDPATHDLVTVNIASMRWRPARGEAPSDLVATGSLDGHVRDGKVMFQRGHLAFRGGTVTDARFVALTQPDGISSRVMGERLHLDLARGDIHVPGGVAVALEGGALDLTKFVTEPSGELTGHVAFALRGATGTIHRKGEALTLSNVVLRSPGLAVDRNQATGPLDVDFTYRLVRPFSVNYPVPELAARTVSLTFEGPMALRLALDDVGAGNEGVVSGTYAFEVPWAPIERAAFEVARARWTQDVAVLVKRVSFEVDPQEFRPCGESCFGAKFRLLAQKLSAKGTALLSERCLPEFQAAIVVDKKARSFVLKGLQVRPHCEGAGGWVVNFLAPFLTKSYEDMTLFKMPPGLPFTIETVKATDATMKIAGAVQWVASSN